MEGPAQTNTIPRRAPIGRVVGQYRIVRELGRGGMGAVYAAVHAQLGHEVALKVLGPADDDGKVGEAGRRSAALAHARFLREGRAAAQLEDARIVRVHDCGTDPNLGPFLVLDLVRSPTLETVINKRSLTIAETRRVVSEVARALAAAHRHGIVHRDVKPANIFFNEGMVDASGQEHPPSIRLTDFGIAKLRDDRELLNMSDGNLVGTPLFMAPEQWRGDPVSPQTDLWALGVLLHVLLVGEPPWSGTLIRVAEQVCNGDFDDLAVRAPEAPADLIALTRRLLSVDPRKRPGSAAEVADASAYAPGERPDRASGEMQAYAAPRGSRASLLDGRSVGTDDTLQFPTDGVSTTSGGSVRGLRVPNLGKPWGARFWLAPLAIGAIGAALWANHARGRTDGQSPPPATVAEGVACTANLECPLGTACVTGGPASGGTGRVGHCDTRAPIRVGVLLPLANGQLAELANSGKLALELVEAVASGELGSEGPPPVLGRGIHFDVRDDEGLASRVPELSAQLRSDNVAAVLGPTTSAQVFASQSVLGSEKILQIAPFAGGRLVGEAQGRDLAARFLFQLAPSVRLGSPTALVAYLARARTAPSRQTCKRVAVVANEDTTGHDYLDSYATLLPLQCMQVVHTAVVPVALQPHEYYEQFAANLAAARPDCVVYACNPPQAGEILRAVAARPGRQPFALGNTTTHSISLFEETSVKHGVNLAAGMVGSDIDGAPNRQELTQLLSLYNLFLKKRNRPTVSELPERFAQWFDAGATVALALELAGPTPTRATLRDAYLEVTTQGEPPGGRLDEVFHPGTLAEAIRSARAHQAVFQSHGGADINYNGASSDLEFLPYGFAQVPMMIWRAELSSTGPRFTTLARYKEGEANIPASCP